MMPIYFNKNGILNMVIGDWIAERARNDFFVTYYHKNRGCKSY